ncbi:MAG: hypothetical protein A2Y80_09815 [Deltaproteobacteria bacterium RBG_13_58_19]|nr:MAG: hypothetical protein A2Y80_09815 [Deltaproteobacteria bacterium RBG_13_58_19]
MASSATPKSYCLSFPLPRPGAAGENIFGKEDRLPYGERLAGREPGSLPAHTQCPACRISLKAEEPGRGRRWGIWRS